MHRMPPAPPPTTTYPVPPPASSGLPSSVSLMLLDNPMKAIGVLCASGGESLAVRPCHLGFLEFPTSAERTSRVASTQPVRLIPHRMLGSPSPRCPTRSTN